MNHNLLRQDNDSLVPPDLLAFFKTGVGDFVCQPLANLYSDRTRYMKVTVGSESYFFKQYTTHLAEQVEAQVLGTQLLGNHLTENKYMTTETIVAYGKDWLLSKWHEGDVLLDSIDLAAPEASEHVAVFAELLAQTDQGCSRTATEPNDLHIGVGLSTANFTDEIIRRYSPLVAAGRVDPTLVTAVIPRLEDTFSRLSPAIQHGDLTPWHVLVQDAGYIIIDCEHVRSDWPRHYDLANFYSILCTRFDRPDLSQVLLDQFATATGVKIDEQPNFQELLLMCHFINATFYQDDKVMFDRTIQYATEQLKRI